MHVTAFDIAQRFIGQTEVKGAYDNPQILAMLRLDAKWPQHDEVPWCSAFANYVAWLLRLPRSYSLRARSWLQVGEAIPLSMALVGYDVVVLKRGKGAQPGPNNLTAPGHVGFYAGRDDDPPGSVMVLGGNQSDSVNVSMYPELTVLGVRRLANM